MKWVKYTLYIFVPLAIAFSIWMINFESVFGDRTINNRIQDTTKDKTESKDEEKTIKFKIAFGIDIKNIKIIPPNEVMFQENFTTSKDVVDFYSEFKIADNFYFDKRKIINSENNEMIIELTPINISDVNLLNRFDNNKVNIDLFLRAGMTLEESIKLESICRDTKLKTFEDIKYEIFPILDPSYRKDFLDYAIEKIIY